MSALDRARAVVASGRLAVVLASSDRREAVVQRERGSGHYSVTLTADLGQGCRWACSCPAARFQRGGPCKHVLGTALVSPWPFHSVLWAAEDAEAATAAGGAT